MPAGAVKYKGLLITFILGLILWYTPVPVGLSPQAWHLFAIFITTIFGIVLNPLPIGAIALLGILVAVLTRTLTIEQALGGFGVSMIWLVVLAFMISRGFIKTGLGKRIAYYFISKIGHSTLGLSYGLVLTDLILAPMIPSVTARGGGIVFPIAKSLAEEYAKHASEGNKKNSTCGFIMQVCFQTNIITSAMFLTAMVGNPLAVKLAANIGVEISWNTWALGAIVPGLLALSLLPLFLYMIYPPSIKITEDAPQKARELLKSMGSISKQEIIMLLTFILLITCWILDKSIGLDATTTALIGVSILLISGILTWNDALQERGAWDTFIWFGTLVMMSDYLSKFGMMSWIGEHVDSLISREYLYLSLVILALFYFYIHYIFASITAHLTVLYTTFLMIFVNLGMPPLPSALLFAYASCLSAGLTHYGIASAPVFYEAKYLSTREWWKVGLLTSFFIILVWVCAGGAWWKILGWI